MKAKYLGLAILLGGLGGCVVHPPQTSEPPASLPPQSQPQPGPSSAPGATRRASPATADSGAAQPLASAVRPAARRGRLGRQPGVYVIRGERDLYYRQRTYYRWDGGWFWSTSPQGPWTETDARGIPPGLSRRYANP